MDIFTYLMSKKGKNYLSHKNDLFAYLLSRSTNKYFYQTFTGITLSVDNTLNAPMKIKLSASEMSQSGTPTPESPQDIHIISGDNTLMIEKGSTATTYEPYVSQEADIDLSSKNLINISGDVATISNYYYINRPLNFAITSDMVGKKLSLSYHIDITNFSSSASAMSSVLGYGATNFDTQLKSVSFSSVSAGSYDVKMENITITSNMVDKQLFIRYLSFSQQSTATCSVKNIQLEYGETCTNYVEYYNPIEYCKIGNYEDKFIRSNDGSWQLEKNIGKVVLDGSEMWENSGAANTFYTTSITDYAISNNIPYSNYYKGVNNVTGAANMGTQNNNTIGFINQSGQTTPRFYIKDTTYTSENDLKTWLTNHNMILYYVLATPTYTQITGTLAEQLENIYQKLKSYKGTTNISQVNNDLPFILHCEIAMKNY